MWKRAILLATLLTAPAAAAEPDYFPLAVGNRWEYGVAGSEERHIGEVLSSESIGDQTWFRVRWLSGKDHWLRVDEEKKLVELDRETEQVSVWIDFRTPTGTPPETDLGICTGATFPVSSKEVCAASRLIFTVYRASVGMIERTLPGFHGPVTMRLLAARIGGEELSF
jgi:hypothetical protein